MSWAAHTKRRRCHTHTRFFLFRRHRRKVLHLLRSKRCWGAGEPSGAGLPSCHTRYASPCARWYHGYSFNGPLRVPASVCARTSNTTMLLCTHTPLCTPFWLSLFPDAGQAVIDELHGKGKGVVCYISIGTVENWRSDKDAFPSKAIGGDVSGWAGEKWLDVNNAQVREVMAARVEKAKSMSCDAVEPDNMMVKRGAANRNAAVECGRVEFVHACMPVDACIKLTDVCIARCSFLLVSNEDVWRPGRQDMAMGPALLSARVQGSTCGCSHITPPPNQPPRPSTTPCSVQQKKCGRCTRRDPEPASTCPRRTRSTTTLGLPMWSTPPGCSSVSRTPSSWCPSSSTSLTSP